MSPSLSQSFRVYINYVKITRQKADAVIKHLKNYLPSSIDIELVGGVASRGYSTKDIDIAFAIDEEDTEFQNWSGEEPYHHQFFRKAGLKLIEDNLEDSEWWKTKDGIILDVFF